VLDGRGVRRLSFAGGAPPAPAAAGAGQVSTVRHQSNRSTLIINIPNFITLGRIMSVPVIFWLLLTGQNKVAFFVFVAAGISDAVDGFLAKRFNWSTELGSYLDPLADKLLIVSIFIALGVRGELPLWLVIAVVSRDILIVAAVLLAWLLDQPVRIKPLAISKANTVAQIVLAATVLADEAFTLGLVDTRLTLVWITGALTLLSLAAYLRAWFMHMAGYESGRSAPD
jgi:cardiolipin synthase (CMP-forming)